MKNLYTNNFTQKATPLFQITILDGYSEINYIFELIYNIKYFIASFYLLYLFNF